MITTLPHSGTATSEAAARNPYTTGKAAHDRRVIAAFIASRGSAGATDQEIAKGCPEVHADAIRARRGECWARSAITKSPGEKRATDSGKGADVWFITNVGLRGLSLPETAWYVRVDA